MRDAVRDYPDHHGAMGPAAGRSGSAAAPGGPVAAIRRSVEAQIGAPALSWTIAPAPSADPAAQLVEPMSRVTEPVALGLAYDATALARPE